MINIRGAKVCDSNQISDVSINTWKEAYIGLIDKSYLDSLVVSEQVIEKWKNRILATKSEDTFIFVATEQDQVVGFIWGGRARETKIENVEFEIYALYVLPKFQCRGIGKKLVDNFKTKINGNFFVWVLLGNRSEHFYLKQKFKKTKFINQLTIGNKKYREIAYLF